MVDELSTLNFTEDVAEVIRLPEAERWKIVPAGPLEIYVELASTKVPGEHFQARLVWNSYPGETPPSLKFRDPQTGRLDLPTAWPVVRGFRPTSLDTCVNYSSEGFRLHPEWVNDPNLKWRTKGNLVLKLLRILQNEMDDQFCGRFKQ